MKELIERLEEIRGDGFMPDRYKESATLAISALQQSDKPKLPNNHRVRLISPGRIEVMHIAGKESSVFEVCENDPYPAPHLFDFLSAFLPKPETAVEMNVSSATVETSKGSGYTAGELLPCPFCGGEAEMLRPDGKAIHVATLVHCPECAVGFQRQASVDAVAVWNQRATTAAPRQEQSEDRESLVEMIDKYMADYGFKFGDPVNFAILCDLAIAFTGDRKLDERLSR